MTRDGICEWLIGNADAPVRHRVYREILKDGNSAKSTEDELFENPSVKLWLKNLKPEDPPQHWSMEHGSFDFCLENALLKAVQLGLHGQMPQLTDSVCYYLDMPGSIASCEQFRIDDKNRPGVPNTGFYSILTVNLLAAAGFSHKYIKDYMLGSLNAMHGFVSGNGYDIYVGEAEKNKLKNVPAIWRDKKFIKRELVEERGFCFPLIYDVIGLHSLYELNDPAVNAKIDSVIGYISKDGFHNAIADGYGILISGNGRYHSMGWDPKYPGWFDVSSYIANGNAGKLLFFAQHISKYEAERETKWYSDLLRFLDTYKTGNGTHIFPSEWFRERRGYAVQGCRLSYGESRRKKNWLEIESTLYMLLLTQYFC